MLEGQRKSHNNNNYVELLDVYKAKEEVERLTLEERTYERNSQDSGYVLIKPCTNIQMTTQHFCNIFKSSNY